MGSVKSVLGLLDLEQIEENIFRGRSEPIVGQRVFGGQVLAQALQAAIATVPSDRLVHSLHGYFILAGDASKPIVYQVERLRDGGSFTTRRITAIQYGRAIFNMAASFQLEQEGLDHQITMPAVPKPDQLRNTRQIAEQYKEQYPDRYAYEMRPHPVEFRPIETPDWIEPENRQPYRHVWFRVKGDMPQESNDHESVLAFISDFYLIGTAIQPHRRDYDFSNLQVASLDHAMWFHRRFAVDQWLLYALDSPSASNTRGFNRGSIFDLDGNLVASVVQEGLIRPKRS